MQPERKQDRDDDDRKTDVNPAARHDRPGTVPPGEERRERESQVPPVQEEPMDPLAPGGIGD